MSIVCCSECSESIDTDFEFPIIVNGREVCDECYNQMGETKGL